MSFTGRREQFFFDFAALQKSAGLAKELFTSANNYVVAIGDGVKNDAKTKKLLLAAALAIDIVYKEK